ncbi:MAG: protein-export chaperone SecB [Armatimonadetes bacterium]|nr:protein-export chaperone SecB [Armatimonadota bacterium]
MSEKQLSSETATAIRQQFKLKPDEYRQILDGLTLLSLELENCTMKSIPDGTGGAPDLSNSIDENKATFELGPDNIVTVKHSYSQKTKAGKNVVFCLDATFRLVFRSEQEFTDDFFAIFRAVSLNFYTWPYFRELLNSLSSKTGMPPLTLPMLKSS